MKLRLVFMLGWAVGSVCYAVAAHDVVGFVSFSMGVVVVLFFMTIEHELAKTKQAKRPK